MEPRDSIDPRATFVLVPNARPLIIIDDAASFRFPKPGFLGAIVWVRDAEGFNAEEFKRNALFACAAAVRVLPRDAEDAVLPSAAGSPAPSSDVSEVRPVVAELVAELPEALREGVAAACDRYLSEAGL